MTNQERFRRHIGDTEICQVCKSGVESIIHVLRDCPAIEGIWRRVVQRHKQQAFFSTPWLEWLFVNLSDTTSTTNGPWSTLLAVMTWWAWWACMEFGEKKL